VRTLYKIIRNNIKYRGQIVAMARANLQKKYKGSDLGAFWAFIKPAMYIAVFYVAISMGFKGAKNIPGLECPYFIWLTIGMMAWFYIRDMLLGGAGAYKRYRVYITKINYPIEIIPSIAASSSLIVHTVLMCAALVLSMLFGVMPSIYWLEIPFYTFFMVLFSIVWSTATGFIAGINKDFYNFLSTMSQAVFWLSAILFDKHRMTSAAAQIFFLFNPVTYIVDGYRNAICWHVWFWEEPKAFGCYLVTFGVMTILAILSFKKFRKILPDYL